MNKPNPYLLTRRCSRCKQDKPEDAFHYRNRERMELQTYCKPCLREVQSTRAVREPDPPAVRALVELVEDTSIDCFCTN